MKNKFYVFKIYDANDNKKMNNNKNDNKNNSSIRPEQLRFRKRRIIKTRQIKN